MMATLGWSSNSPRARSSQPSATSQSPSRNCTKHTPESICNSRSNPAFRARAAVNGMDMSRSTTSMLRDRASATLSSVEPEST